MNRSPKQDHTDHETGDYARKLQANWSSRKKKAIAASKNPGQTSSEHIAKDLKVKLLTVLLIIVTTIALFVIMFWNEPIW